MSQENWDHEAGSLPKEETLGSVRIEFTQTELKFLRLAVLTAEREDIHRGGSRDYHFEDQCKALKDKLREAGDDDKL